MVPVLRLGDIAVGTHDLFSIAGILVGLLLYYLALRRRGMLDERILIISLAVLIGGGIGGRLLLAFQHLGGCRLSDGVRWRGGVDRFPRCRNPGGRGVPLRHAAPTSFSARWRVAGRRRREWQALRMTPTASDVRRWRRYLSDERAEASVYRDLARLKDGEEAEILRGLADAEDRHAAHWERLLGDQVGRAPRPGLRFRVLGPLARSFGSVFVLAIAQRAEIRSGYAVDADATASMAADEQIHAEVVRALATRGRNKLAGTFRAAVFGANDGLVSNVALVIGVAATGTRNSVVLLTGLAGLLAGALSMAAGEFISVRSQRELLAASTPSPDAAAVLPDLDVDANELALVYRARGLTPEDAQSHADEVMADIETLGAAGRRFHADTDPDHDPHEAVGTAWGASISSFAFFSCGAVIPVVPYLCGLVGMTALAVALAAVGLALMATGALVGLMSGGPPLRRALRQLAIGLGAAGITYGLGAAFGTTLA